MHAYAFAFTLASKWWSRMVVMEHSDLEGRSTTNINSLLHESVLQRAGKPRKYKGSLFSGNKRTQTKVEKTESHKEFLRTQ